MHMRMDLKRFRIQFMAFALLLLVQHATAQDCDPKENGFLHPRTFYIMYQGPPSIFANRTMASNNLGDCRSAEEHAEKMITYFESSYGVNMDQVRRNPYEVYNDSRINLAPFMQHPDGIYMCIASTFYEYAEFINAPLTSTAWAMSAKTNLRGPKGMLPSGLLAVYGLLQFKVQGRDLCIEYTERTPVQPPNEIGAYPIDFILQNEDLGMGYSRGLSILKSMASMDSFFADINYAMIFPAKT